MKLFNERKKTLHEGLKSLYNDAASRKERHQQRVKENDEIERALCEAGQNKYSEANQVFMCIRITRELKTVYEQQVRLGLSDKIGFPVFVKILTLLGYLNSNVSSNYMLPTMSQKEESLVVLAWRTVRSRGDENTEIVGNDEFAEFAQVKADKHLKKAQEFLRENKDAFDYVSFENFAMLLNLINNVYIKNNI